MSHKITHKLWIPYNYHSIISVTKVSNTSKPQR